MKLNFSVVFAICKQPVPERGSYIQGKAHWIIDLMLRREKSCETCNQKERDNTRVTEDFGLSLEVQILSR